MWIVKANEYLAVKITKYFGNMWTFYVFFVWGLLAFVPQLSHYKEMILMISSAWIQLWALPALAVGNAILSRDAEKRAQQDHESLVEMHNMMHETLKLQEEEIKHMEELLNDIYNGRFIQKYNMGELPEINDQEATEQ